MDNKIRLADYGLRVEQVIGILELLYPQRTNKSNEPILIMISELKREFTSFQIKVLFMTLTSRKKIWEVTYSSRTLNRQITIEVMAATIGSARTMFSHSHGDIKDYMIRPKIRNERAKEIIWEVVPSLFQGLN